MVVVDGVKEGSGVRERRLSYKLPERPGPGVPSETVEDLSMADTVESADRSGPNQG